MYITFRFVTEDRTFWGSNEPKLTTKVTMSVCLYLCCYVDQARYGMQWASVSVIYRVELLLCTAFFFCNLLYLLSTYHPITSFCICSIFLYNLYFMEKNNNKMIYNLYFMKSQDLNKIVQSSVVLFVLFFSILQQL